MVNAAQCELFLGAQSNPIQSNTTPVAAPEAETVHRCQAHTGLVLVVAQKEVLTTPDINHKLTIQNIWRLLHECRYLTCQSCPPVV